MITIKDIKRKNLRRLLEKTGLSQAELSRRTGIATQYITDLLNGNKGFSDKKDGVLAKAFGVHETEFYIGIFPDQSDSEKSSEQTLNIQVASQSDKDLMNGIADDYRGIPLYESGRLASGINGVAFDPYETPVSMVVVYKPELQGCSRHNLAAIKVGGDSMEPTITKGSIVVVDLSDKEYFDGKVFVVYTPEGGMDVASVKRLQKWDLGFILLSDNSKYPPVSSQLDWNRLCVGRVVWIWRDARNI